MSFTKSKEKLSFRQDPVYYVFDISIKRVKLISCHSGSTTHLNVQCALKAQMELYKTLSQERETEIRLDLEIELELMDLGLT